MKIMYDITNVKETEDGVRVEARFFEGDFEQIEKKNQDDNLMISQEFVRKEHLYDIAKYFDTKTTKADWTAWFTTFMSKDTEGREPLWTLNTK